MKTALVLGGAAGVWTDVKAAFDLGLEFDGVIACNDMVASWPGKLDAAVSLHAEMWPVWLTRRRLQGHPAPARVFAHLGYRDGVLDKTKEVTDYVEYRFKGQENSGSSGLFAVKVALEDLGFDRAVICGIPMSKEQAHFFDSKPWIAAQAHQRGWDQAAAAIGDRLRSMSGWTALRHGKPDQSWLHSEA